MLKLCLHVTPYHILAEGLAAGTTADLWCEAHSRLFHDDCGKKAAICIIKRKRAGDPMDNSRCGTEVGI